jgi:hypothetical protein
MIQHFQQVLDLIQSKIAQRVVDPKLIYVNGSNIRCNTPLGLATRSVARYLIVLQVVVSLAFVDQSSSKDIKVFFRPAKRSVLRSSRIRLNQLLYKNSQYKYHLSSDSFAKLADYYVFGRTGHEPLERKMAFQSRVVFVNSDRLNQLDFNLFPNLKVVMAGNSDHNFYNKPKVPNNIELLLLQNCAVSDKIMKTLPIGLENKSTGRYSSLRHFSQSISKEVFNPKILVPPMSDTNPIRQTVIKDAEKFPKIFDINTQYLHEKQYFDLIKKYQFLLCLEGNGFENHRIWESLYLGIFPVMLKSDWSLSLKYLKLPILLVDEISEITEEMLQKFWQKNLDFNPESKSELWTRYWEDLIASHLGN